MRIGALVWTAILLALLPGQPLWSQSPIYVPPPVDPVEPIVMEPDIDPGLPLPGNPPPPATALPMTNA